MRKITTDDLVNWFKEGKKCFSFLLGAGASCASGIPSSASMIWDFKRTIYCNETNESPEKYKDLLSDYTQSTLQRFFDEESKAPDLYSSAEYSYYFERCYTTIGARKLYIENQVRGKKPSLGYLCLGKLVSNEYVDKIFTTNFDDLILQGINTINPNIRVNTISHINAITPFHQGITSIVKLHGDYLYDNIQNTEIELIDLLNNVKKSFIDMVKSTTLIVIGFAGNDNSVMSTLESLLESGDWLHGIIWCSKKGCPLSDRAKLLMEKACNINSNSCVVDINSFDDLLYRLYSINGYENNTINEVLSNTNTNQPLRFIRPCSNDVFVKTNSHFAITTPKCLVFDTDINSWKQLREINQNRAIVALYNGQVIALSDIRTLDIIFGEHVQSQIKECSLLSSDNDGRIQIDLGLCYELIDKHLIDNLHFDRVDKREYVNRSISNDKEYYDAFIIHLSFVNKKLTLTYLPTVVMKNDKLSIQEKKSRVNRIVSERYNKKMFDLLKQIRDNLLSGSQSQLEFRCGDHNISFDRVPISCGAKNQNVQSLNLYMFKEPEVVFSAQYNQGYVNQLKGLIDNQPLSCTYQFISQKAIRLAIFSPQKEVRTIISHLNGLNSIANNTNKYNKTLPGYSGFENVFKRKLIVPIIGSQNLFAYNSFNENLKTYDAFFQYFRSNLQKIVSIQNEFDILIVYIPKRYKFFREQKTRDACFDLHDKIKLECVQYGIKVQIIEERSVVDTNKCKVLWGLATSIFVKANGELWKPKEFNPQTAFIGLSYSSLQDGHHYIGCSQMFDSAGNGMRLHLKQLYDPIVKYRNPYMRSSDARSIIGDLRNTYVESVTSHRLTRIVVHKSNPFLQSEINGINQALTGIDDIEILQIQEYPLWRGVLGTIRSNNNRLEYLGMNFPIKRGTVIQLDDNTMLLWTHGLIIHNEIDAGKNYYKDSRGIPAPLLIRRYQGKGSADELISEILMLTKMNFNSCGNIYKLLPVTLDFAKTISRIVKQQEIAVRNKYDFRYFM